MFARLQATATVGDPLAGVPWLSTVLAAIIVPLALGLQGYRRIRRTRGPLRPLHYVGSPAANT